MEEIWKKFIHAVKQTDSESLRRINSPATEKQLSEAEAALGSAFHEDVKQLYRLANGFAAGAYLLLDDYRILPLNEMIAESLFIVGQRVSTDCEAGESKEIKKSRMLILALAAEDNCDVEKIGISVKRGKTDVVLWYKEGGIHDYEEAVNTSETLEEWLTLAVNEYY